VRHRLTGKQREALYASEAEKAREAGNGDFPICALCHFPILPGREWNENHQGHKPRWLGGTVDGISRDDAIKKTMRGEVVDRATGEPWKGWR
jgi:hypothetical protein